MRSMLRCASDPILGLFGAAFAPETDLMAVYSAQ